MLIIINILNKDRHHILIIKHMCNIKYQSDNVFVSNVLIYFNKNLVIARFLHFRASLI